MHSSQACLGEWSRSSISSIRKRRKQRRFFLERWFSHRTAPMVNCRSFGARLGGVRHGRVRLCETALFFLSGVPWFCHESVLVKHRLSSDHQERKRREGVRVLTWFVASVSTTTLFSTGPAGRGCGGGGGGGGPGGGGGGGSAGVNATHAPGAGHAHGCGHVEPSAI